MNTSRSSNGVLDLCSEIWNSYCPILSPTTLWHAAVPSCAVRYGMVVKKPARSKGKYFFLFLSRRTSLDLPQLHNGHKSEDSWG